MAPLHDSLIAGYSVDGASRELVLRTKPHRGAGGHFDVRFTDVVAYHLEGDCFQNILSEILEVPAGVVIRDAEVAARHREFGWPAGWEPGRETLPQFVAREGARFYQLICSYGMGGWVAARAMTVVRRDGDATQPAVAKE
jgi:hypothetical protein